MDSFDLILTKQNKFAKIHKFVTLDPAHNDQVLSESRILENLFEFIGEDRVDSVLPDKNSAALCQMQRYLRFEKVL